MSVAITEIQLLSLSDVALFLVFISFVFVKPFLMITFGALECFYLIETFMLNRKTAPKKWSRGLKLKKNSVNIAENRKKWAAWLTVYNR